MINSLSDGVARMDDDVHLGRWIFSIGKHLRSFASTAEVAYLYATTKSARDGDLLLRLRGLGRVSVQKLRALALDAGIAPQELAAVLSKLELTELIVQVEGSDGKLREIEEQILTEQEVYRGIARLFELYQPSDSERILAPLLDLLSRLPLREDEVIDRMCRLGYDEEQVRQALELQEAFGLLNRKHVGDLGTSLLYNEYLWGHKISKIGDILVKLHDAEKEHLLRLIEEVRSDQGRSLDQLSSAPKHIIDMAANTGIIDTTTISTLSNDEKTFAFSPHFYGYQAGAGGRTIDDHADQVKLFVASIGYGVNHSADFRLRDPYAFVSRLLRDGEAGNATPILRDYPLLEKQGIVVVEERSAGRGTFVLKKRDIVEQALRVMQNGSMLSDAGRSIDARTLVSQRRFRSPETNRLSARFGKFADLTPTFNQNLLAAVRETAQKEEWS